MITGPHDNKQKNPPETFDFNEPDLTAQEMKMVLETSPTGIAVIKDRTVCWANNIFYAMFAYEPGSLIGRNTICLYRTQQEFDRVGVLLYTEADQYGHALIETQMVKKTGSVFDCRIRASRIDRQDPEKGFIVMVADISELKMLQIQLQQAQKMEAIGILAGGISHDFNNILMGIQGHLSLMQIDVTNADKVRNHTKHINNLVKTAAELTSRLLGFARGGKYQISTLNVNELLKLALNIFQPTRKDIVIHENYEEHLYMVDADQSQLEQIFLNLLINASQAMPDQGNIYTRTENLYIDEDHDYPFHVDSGRYIRVTIKDSGVGMDTETQKKIFDPFFSTKEIGDRKGRGLGLSTVYGVVKNHGGFILVDSEKGQGATFQVCLPAADDTDQETPDLTNSFEMMQKGSETVLLVDDEEEVVNVGKNYLEKLGYTALVARNGLEAVEIFKLYKDDIALVVLDLIMPIMDGKKAFAEIRNIQKDAKILISTGYTVDRNDEAFLSQESNGFIQKPFSLNDFSSALRNILD